MSSVDFSYLEGFLGGDISIAIEVVGLFRKQAATWSAGLDSANPDWRAVVHTVKGAARGIGANALGDACHAAEVAAAGDLAAVRAALAAALADIAAYEAARAA
ncbi:Hpt domain-containing protein [Phenylobacterium sp. LjRoot219]|uniref:Hpt domain-containing protein n=1 Tax=Phenylobacterium sp. LjRoot219 TaxID=3342283 RepID=UPI003ECDB13F